MDISLMDVINKAWVFVCGYYWWDKNTKESRIKDLEAKVNNNITNSQLTDQRLDALQKLLETKLDSLKESMDEIKGKL